MERAEVLQQKLEHWCAASVRALANDATVHYRGHSLYRHQQHFPLHAPYLHLDFSTHEARQLRGVADAIALRLRFSDPLLHHRLSPDTPLQKLVFELLEQLRTESLVPLSLAGMKTNLRSRFLFWARQASTSKLVENEIGLLIFTLTVMAWSRLLSEPIPEQIEDVIEATRWGLAADLGAHLRALKNHRQDQTNFSEIALIVAEKISVKVGELFADDGDDSSVENKLQELVNTTTLSLKWLESDSEIAQNHFGISRPEALEAFPADFQYRIFTKEFDKEVEIGSLIRATQLKKFRAQLDKRIRQQSVNTYRLARHLKALVASPALLGWSFGEEEGYLDSARLTRLITSPNERTLFRKESKKPQSDCVVSILVDNSGSMNHHNETVASLVDTLARALELAGISSEVMGFTTGDWNGGKVMTEWVAAGKPDNPGRLNSLQHTIYKDVEIPWRRSRPAIAGMLRTDLFRESFDGEALEWAVKRLELRPERRKIVLVISDGSPMDTATLKTNHERYLDHHLAQVAQAIEQRSDIQLCALGVGLDLSQYYKASLAITLDNELTTKDYLAVAELLQRSA